MRHFERINSGIDVSGVMAQLRDHPDLWGAIPFRTAPGSPHEGCPDIWLRFRALDEVVHDPVRAIEPHIPVFYPAWWKLTELHDIVYGLMAQERAVQLGGILITKIPPGGEVKRHADKGWHPTFFNCKIYVVLEGNDQCINRVEGESVVMRPGECWRFNNLLTHSVENNGKTERQTLIVCLRTEL